MNFLKTQMQNVWFFFFQKSDLKVPFKLYFNEMVCESIGQQLKVSDY